MPTNPNINNEEGNQNNDTERDHQMICNKELQKARRRYYMRKRRANNVSARELEKEKNREYMRKRRAENHKARALEKEDDDEMTDAEEDELQLVQPNIEEETINNDTERDHQMIRNKELQKAKRRDYMRKRRANNVSARELEKEKNREYMRKRRAENHEARALEKNNNRENMRKRRAENHEARALEKEDDDEMTDVEEDELQLVQPNIEEETINTRVEVNEDEDFHFSQTYSDADILQCTKEFQKKLENTLLQSGEIGYIEGQDIHKACVCVVCDRCIIGTEDVQWIETQILQFHENVLSSEYHYGQDINPLLKEQYSLDNDRIRHLLLSTRARYNLESDSYMCCSYCKQSLCPVKQRKRNTPPKFAISNGFAIGSIPSTVSHGITPVVNNLVAPIRAFNYFLTFNSGREHKITGNFTFFSQNVSENMGALTFTAAVNNTGCLYVVLQGSFTQTQLDLIRRQGIYNVDTFKKVYNFLRVNNSLYSNLPDVEHVPTPLVQEVRDDEDNIHDGDQSTGNNEECITWKYWFPNVEEPNNINGTHESQGEFAKAIMTGETPTLIYHPSEILFNASLSELCPTAFPFGTGDIKVERKPPVSEIECLKHYMKLSLPQFLEGQLVLIVHHMFQRRISFLTGITKCNQSHNGVSMATDTSDITAEEIDELITQMKNRNVSSQYNNEFNTSQKVKSLLRNIRTCCMPIGYTNEAAADARTNMFSLWTSFGPPSLLFTFSPCDECSLNMHLFATTEAIPLPGLNHYQEIMTTNLSLRKTLRVKYPGASAREFDNLFQLVLSHILGWGRKERKGIFGKLEAYSASVEEQGRTTLHVHIILWLCKFQTLQHKLFSSDNQERLDAQAELKEYMNKVLSTSFELSDLEVQQSLKHFINCGHLDECNGIMEGVSFQSLRKMRHRQHLKEEKGVIMKCNNCSTSHNTVDIINQVLLMLLPTAKSEYPAYPVELLKIPLTTEQMDLLALRFRYDMIHLPENATTLRRVLQLIMLLYYNTHDWKHRKSCFKKGVECRFNLPQLPCEGTTISFNNIDCDHSEIDGECISNADSKWYFVDGTYRKVSSYEIIPKRKVCDAFVNAHNRTVSNVLGYNNNICMGSINTLYYCTLYSSKSTQDEETHSYLRAVEAVSKRIKSLEQRDDAPTLSSSQVGLRRLLSGINAHISSNVVSATMAWYLIVHGSRFQYSHSFKPLLLSQLESWYIGEQISQRIRHKKRNVEANNSSDNLQLDEDTNEVWFDSDINNYLFRPDHEDFNNLSIWEFHCLYDMKVMDPNKEIERNQQHDPTKKYWRFHNSHPGSIYCCLVKQARDSLCIPKLYYRTKFPDVASLEMYDDNRNPCNHVKELREVYALKALLLFMPFRCKYDLMADSSSLWDIFTLQRERLRLNSPESPHLYLKTDFILQNIQNMYNVKKVPPSKDQLLACTNAVDVFPSSELDCRHLHENCDTYEEEESEEHTTLYLEAIMKDLNDSFQNSSTFNNNLCSHQLSQLRQLQTAIIPIEPSDATQYALRPLNYSEQLHHDSNNTVQCSGTFSTLNCLPNTLITVITRALDVQNINLSLQVSASATPDNGFNFDLASMDTFANGNNLDSKQNIAFQAICASFILTYLLEPEMTCTQDQRLLLQQQLQSKGACTQLLMCVTGPGGSGKSHVIKCCRMYCKMFCTAINKHFDFSVFPITATSNSAASLLKGKTIHSAALLNHKRIAREYSASVDWTATKVLIIDEISMAGIDMFRKLDKNLRILTGNRSSLYGGIHVISMGDFMQLSPVGYPPIYKSNDDLHWHGSLNAAIFLDVANHRFSKDPEWGDILQRIQIGEPTEEDLLKINERYVPPCDVPEAIDCATTRLVYGCFSNKRRNEITNACFLHYVLQHNPNFNSSAETNCTTLLIKGYFTKNNKYLGDELHKLLWAICGDNNLDADGRKVDPCLKLIQGYPLMINSNMEKERHLAKGTVGNFMGVRWKPGCGPHTEDFHGFKVLATEINDVECLLMALEGEDHIVELKPETVMVNIKHELLGRKIEVEKCNITQFPVNLSLATTGHKLQGMTKDILILAEINTRTPNWLYVVLSRVTTMKGLYLTTPLTKNMFKPIARDLQRELDFLRNLESQLIRRLENYIYN